MIEIPFWQSAAAGAVLAALITALSSLFQRRRDDRLESRRSRREAGAKAIEVAYRYRDLIGDVIALKIYLAKHPDGSEALLTSTRHELSEAMTAWRGHWLEIGTAAATARALAAPGVEVALEKISQIGLDWHRASQDTASLEEASEAFQESIDNELNGLAHLVRSDAKTDVGVSIRARLQHRRMLRKSHKKNMES